MKLVLGITGGSGSGKSTAARIFAGLGAEVIDADVIARRVTAKGSPALGEIAAAFGQGVITPEGELNRPALAEIVFRDGEKLGELNKITHPHILNEIKAQIEKSQGPYVVVDAAALFESGGDALCDFTVAVIAPGPMRLNRIIPRDNIGEGIAAARIAAQKDDDYYTSRADFVIENSGSLNDLRRQVENIMSEIKAKQNP